MQVRLASDFDRKTSNFPVSGNENTAMPCPYNIILGRDTAVPCPPYLLTYFVIPVGLFRYFDDKVPSGWLPLCSGDASMALWPLNRKLAAT